MLRTLRPPAAPPRLAGSGRRAARALLLGSAVLATVLLGGCAESPAGDDAGIYLVVRDNGLRVLGESCSGARPYQYLHRGAELVFTAADEEVRVTLPDGEAVAVDDTDYGAAPRVPSYCRFSLPASALTAGVEYALAVDGRDVGAYTHEPAEPPLIAVPPLADLESRNAR